MHRYFQKTGLALYLLFAVIAGHAQNKTAHFKSVLIDTHNDILTTIAEEGVIYDTDLRGRTHSDLERMKKGGVDVQIFSVWCDGNKKDPFQWANREIDSLYAIVQRNPGKMQIIYNTAELGKIVKENKLAALMGLEGGHMIENDLDKLQSLYKRGVRYMTLTWNNSTDWASSAMDETKFLENRKGLSDFGKKVVKRMNELGMMVDLSHVGEQTFFDAIAVTSKPVIVSHSCAYALCPVFRNLKDEQIKAVKKNNGVICLNFYSGFVDSSFERKRDAFLQEHKTEMDSLKKINSQTYFLEQYFFKKYAAELNALRPSLDQLLDHLDHMVKVAGINHVGLGSDFDGISSSPQELDDVTDFPKITVALLKRGYTKKEIKKILGGNVLRVMKENER